MQTVSQRRLLAGLHKLNRRLCLINANLHFPQWVRSDLSPSAFSSLKTRWLHQQLQDFKGSILECGVIGHHIMTRRFRQEQPTSFLVLFLLLLLFPWCIFPVITICSRENTAVKRLLILTYTLFKWRCQTLTFLDILLLLFYHLLLKLFGHFGHCISIPVCACSIYININRRQLNKPHSWEEKQIKWALFWFRKDVEAAYK